MFNVTGSEIVIVLLLALVVLGPEKLPDAVRRFAKTYAELKKVGTGFQQEFRSAMDEPLREMRETADLLRSSADFGAMADAAMSAAETTAANADGSKDATDADDAAAGSEDVTEGPDSAAAGGDATPGDAAVTTPERPRQIWSAAPPYRIAPAAPATTDPETDGSDGTDGTDAGLAAAEDPGDAAEDRPA